MVQIADLGDHPHLIPQLVAGIEAQWPDYVASQPPGVTLKGFHSADQWLVAFEGDTALGTVALREHTEPVFAALKPALGSLWVHPARRGQGVGTALVEAGMRLAAQHGAPTIYAYSINAAGLLTRIGWRRIDTVFHDGVGIGAYAATLAQT